LKHSCPNKKYPEEQADTQVFPCNKGTSDGELQESQEVDVPEHVLHVASQSASAIGVLIVVGAFVLIAATLSPDGESIDILNELVSPTVVGFKSKPTSNPN
jgi:hypothetical protein